MKYKVRLMMDDTYEVVETMFIEDYDSTADDDEAPTKENSVYQGRLADCEAYIRLHEGGYM